ncbi:MAG TPA: ChbG/HpnK family deacetylase [Pyrinomonadaceae bacterium]|nr:ChbG/HpnK family deacetylase [Pyrinomonadaceae bacterium]
MSLRKILIVNADDFGMNRAVTEGIINAFKNGIVRSTSLMVNMPETNRAAQTAKKNESLEVGIHLNISEGFCVSPPEDVYLLVDKNGRFNFDVKNIPESMRIFRQLIETTPKILSQISLEFENQINLFNQFDLKLSHINIHHYLSLLHQKLFEIYSKTAEKCGVPYRRMCSPMFELLNSSANDKQTVADFSNSVSVSSPCLSISHLLDGTSLELSNEEYCETMKSKINGFLRNNDLKCLELIVHPTLENISAANDDYATVKKIETSLVLNNDFANYLKRAEFEISGYSGLLL